MTMPILSLPVAAAQLNFHLLRRRSQQESAFTGAVRQVISPGGVWRGSMQLPAIRDVGVWQACRAVLRRVIDGEARLAVYLYGEDKDPDAVDRLGFSNPLAYIIDGGDFVMFGGTPDHLQHFPASGQICTFHYSQNDHKRAVMTQLTESGLSTAQVPRVAGREGQPLNPPGGWGGNNERTIYRAFPSLSILHPGSSHAFLLEPGVEQDTYCPAIVLNDDALGHTMSDDLFVPNRIEWQSSSVWPDWSV